MCTNNCNTCNHLVKSTSIEVSGTNLRITIPTRTLANRERLCIVVAQNIPETATVGMNVVIYDGATTIPIITANGNFLYADQLRCRRVLHTIVATDVPLAKLATNSRVCCSMHSFPVINQASATATTESKVVNFK